MGSRLSGLGSALYDSKRKEFLGRDGGKWGKLGVFYFFFYIGLAGFFCAMLAIFMALTPRDHPYYTAEDSRMTTRSNPLSPGLGFRPQPNVERNLIEANKTSTNNAVSPYADSLNKYLHVYYWNQSSNDQYYRNQQQQQQQQDISYTPFVINRPGECTSNRQYGYTSGKPCVLVKMNKIVDFQPEPVDVGEGEKDLPQNCQRNEYQIPVACQGEYPADVDNIGRIRYISENGQSDYCGSLNKNRLIYTGKKDRKDVYQAPYIWAQFLDPKPNVLINVICRAYANNIDYDKKAGRGLTRFQIFVNDPKNRASRSVGEL